jgi:hypothetical protein
MDTSIFSEKSLVPNDNLLRLALENRYPQWMEIRTYVFERYPEALEEWKFSGPKYGWSFRIKDKKRVLLYLLPRDGYFLVAFVFGEKAVKEIMASNISFEIKNALDSARVYAEGRGIRIEVRDHDIIEDIRLLTEIKLAH